MKALSNLTIGARLGGAFTLMLATLAGIAGYGALNVDRMHDALEESVVHNLEPIEHLGEIRALMLTNRVLVAEMTMLHGDAPAVEQRDRQLRANVEKVGQLWERYTAGVSSDEDKPLAAAFAQTRGAYVKDGLLATRDAVRAGHKVEADRLYNERTVPLGATSAKALDNLTARLAQQAERAVANAQQLERSTYAVTAAVAGVALLFGTLMAWAITRSIAGPMQHARAAAGRVAEGDLSVDLSAAGRDETAQLLRALEHMRQNLARIVQEVRGNAENVATASAQIAQGNADLSQRTEEQASSLQQTAATMEQLGTTVRQNADNAQQANQLALSASEVAVQGGTVVGRVVDTMKDISESSKKIAEIIATIDGIAFQTNILALNAAVEAARAGEQGRGFAVVAGEVRALAQRSAEAAREIKSLIGASVERVDQGSALVDQAGKTMNEVVASIKRVTDIVGEISAASVEQSSGVGQVGQAVTQMDQVTQQNAALVEESAAAAESLKGQAQQLVQAVSVFRLAA